MLQFEQPETFHLLNTGSQPTNTSSDLPGSLAQAETTWSSRWRSGRRLVGGWSTFEEGRAECAAGGAYREGTVEVVVFVRDMAVFADVLEAVHDQHVSMETVDEGLKCLCTYLGSPRLITLLEWVLRSLHCQP